MPPLSPSQSRQSFSEPSSDQLQQLLTSMEGRRIAVIGDLMLDAYLIGPVGRISPEAPVPVLEVTDQQFKLGGAANVARCLVELGAKVKMTGVIGDDSHGRRLQEAAQQYHIDTSALIADPARPTTCKTRVVARDQQVIRLDQESKTPVASTVQTQLLEQINDLCQWAEAIVLSDYAKGVLTNEVCRRAIADANNKPVVVDPKHLPWERFQGATVVKPNRLEASHFAGGTLPDNSDIFEVAKNLASHLHIKNALITCGADGMTLATRPATNSLDFAKQHFPACPHELVDVTGAGDVVSATLALALATGADAPTAAWLANVAAGVKVGKFGAAAVSAQEILDALHVPIGYQSKVMSSTDAAAFAQQQRQQGKRVVFTNGCFDLLHVGHVRYLERSRRQGDLLIVGVNSNDSVSRLKGPDRPIQTEDDRAQIVASQANVDGVVVFEEDTPTELIRLIKPDVLTKGGDYKSKQEVVGWDLVESWGGRVELIDFVDGRSTSKIISKAA